MNIFTHFITSKERKDETRKQAILQDLIRLEANLNKDIFGPVPRGVKRDFFNLDKNTWVWHEEWTDKAGNHQQLTTRYVVRPKQILKSQNGGAYFKLTIDEVKNFRKATSQYVKKAKSDLYATDKKPAKV